MRCRKAMEREGPRGTPESPWRKGMDVELADAWGGRAEAGSSEINTRLIEERLDVWGKRP